MPGILNPNRRDQKDLGATFRRIFKCIFLHFILKSLSAKEYPQRPYKALKQASNSCQRSRVDQRTSSVALALHLGQESRRRRRQKQTKKERKKQRKEGGMRRQRSGTSKRGRRRESKEKNRKGDGKKREKEKRGKKRQKGKKPPRCNASGPTERHRALMHNGSQIKKAAVNADTEQPAARRSRSQSQGPSSS